MAYLDGSSLIDVLKSLAPMEILNERAHLDLEFALSETRIVAQRVLRAGSQVGGRMRCWEPIRTPERCDKWAL